MLLIKLKLYIVMCLYPFVWLLHVKLCLFMYFISSLMTKVALNRSVGKSKCWTDGEERKRTFR